MEETKLGRAYQTLKEVAAEHAIEIADNEQVIVFSEHLPSFEIFVSAIQSRGYNIPVQTFLCLYEQPVTFTVAASTLAGHDDTEGYA